MANEDLNERLDWLLSGSTESTDMLVDSALSSQTPENENKFDKTHHPLSLETSNSGPNQFAESNILTAKNDTKQRREARPKLGCLSLIAVLFIIAGLTYTFWPKPATPLPIVAVDPSSVPTQTPQPEAHPPNENSTTSKPVPISAVPTVPLVPGGVELSLTPAPEAMGWVTSQNGSSYSNVPNIHAGRLNGHTYYGFLQFDLSSVPNGSKVSYANLSLTGLDSQYLAEDGQWQLQLLLTDGNRSWENPSYQAVHQAKTDISIFPPLSAKDLASGAVNTFTFGPEQISVLQKHLENSQLQFRIAGPDTDADNRFTWDSGYRNKAVLESIPTLNLVVVPPPKPDYVIVTSTPLPENIITVAAQAATATDIATVVGTFTPVPDFWVTPVIVNPLPTPANTATAEHLQAVATAGVFLFGTPTPTPENVWTVTPTPTPTPVVVTPTGTPAPPTLTATPMVVTSTPNPENIVTVAAIAVQATHVAKTVGTYTPVPANWITPVIVTPTPAHPAPGNAATAIFREQLATAEAFLYDRNTLAPINVWTATPTPVLVPVVGQVATPWAAFTPTPTPIPVPAQLVGKIAFLSNRSGGPEPLRRALVYVIDPDGGNLSVLTNPAVYETAVTRDQFSSDQRFRSFVKDAVRFDSSRVPAIYWLDYLYNAEGLLTHFGAGEAWNPVWSPTEEKIAFVSNDSSDDEIWVAHRDGSQLQRLTSTNEEYNGREIGKDTFLAEQNGHPSWSPDGTQIVFWSNRGGNRQIWVMNADGSNPRCLSIPGHDDWDPVWIKYVDPVNHFIR